MPLPCWVQRRWVSDGIHIDFSKYPFPKETVFQSFNCILQHPPAPTIHVRSDVESVASRIPWNLRCGENLISYRRQLCLHQLSSMLQYLLHSICRDCFERVFQFELCLSLWDITIQIGLARCDIVLSTSIAKYGSAFFLPHDAIAKALLTLLSFSALLRNAIGPLDQLSAQRRQDRSWPARHI